MANTVIVSPTGEPVRIGDSASPALGWRCLARRGMVFCELEGFEHLTVAPNGALHGPAHPSTEQIVFVVSGEATAEVGGRTFPLTPGEVLLLGIGGKYTLTNTGEGALELLTVEFIPAQIADRLPRRTPQLIDIPATASVSSVAG